MPIQNDCQCGTCLAIRQARGRAPFDGHHDNPTTAATPGAGEAPAADPHDSHWEARGLCSCPEAPAADPEAPDYAQIAAVNHGLYRSAEADGDALRVQLRELAAELEDEAARCERAGTAYGEGESVGLRAARRSVLRIADGAAEPATPPAGAPPSTVRTMPACGSCADPHGRVLRLVQAGRGQRGGLGVGHQVQIITGGSR